MKIKVKSANYKDVISLPSEKHIKPIKQGPFWRWLMATLSKAELKAVDFEYENVGMDKLGKDEPCLYLMNHSSFTDLQIVATILKDRQFHIVCTNDGMIGKASLMRKIGCIPTKKFIMDTTLVKDMKYSFDTLKSSVVMYPEASYSFDGSQTPLPDSIGKCIKLMGAPVVMIRTHGAFIRDPLYNNLQKRKAKVTAKVKYVLSPEECKELSASEINNRINAEFTYDHFREQYDAGVIIDEPFRADGLHRVLYKCPNCNMEKTMLGEGISIKCSNCGDTHTLQENGKLSNEEKTTAFTYITDWYNWERECVREEISDGKYLFDADVDIYMLVDEKCIYQVGEGHLHHDYDGFTLNGCDGELEFSLKSTSAYSLYSDYFWYEIGDMICIGDTSRQYYCFPKDREGTTVAKVRLATEEIYKLHKAK